MKPRLFIQACNVHQGGGATLLNALVKANIEANLVILQVDERMQFDEGLSSNIVIKRIPPTVWQRFRAELWLKHNLKTGDYVLCLGNLPPLFKTAAKVFVFLQNRYLLINQNLSSFSTKKRLRIYMEYWWLRFGSKNADYFIVQTPSMALALNKTNITKNRDIQIIPFYLKNNKSIKKHKKHEFTNLLENKTSKSNKDKKIFLYVATGESHKNHRRLIEAWKQLSLSNIYPNLWLTLDPIENKILCEWINKVSKKYNLNIYNWGNLESNQIDDLYSNANALIYPSLFESFGLPLIEAKMAGIDIISSELDYVRDVVEPKETFDPTSAISIARAVRRYVNHPELPIKILEPDQFIKILLNI